MASTRFILLALFLVGLAALSSAGGAAGHPHGDQGGKQSAGGNLQAVPAGEMGGLDKAAAEEADGHGRDDALQGKNNKEPIKPVAAMGRFYNGKRLGIGVGVGVGIGV
ncbi:hypothetical protein ACP4OV_027999 [Aristida adscensionis]